jgi:hypothetical protein
MKQVQPADDGDFLKLLEAGVRDVLRDKDAKRSDKLKAVEIGSKLLVIRHKIDGGDGSDGSFFTKAG